MKLLTAEWVDKAEGDFVDLAFLSEFAVSFRYPGELADRESAMSRLSPRSLACTPGLRNATPHGSARPLPTCLGRFPPVSAR
jgi:hypothetical protein